METIDQIQQLFSTLQQRSSDIKPEVLLWQAICSGIPQNAFVVKNNHFFEREFVSDLVEADIIEDDWQRRFLELSLSRPGLYDMLPESLFFQPDNIELHRKPGAAEMAAQYQQNKLKERELRKFFQPFENELFYQQLQLEKEESALLDTLRNKVLNRFLADFWGLPAALPAEVAASLIILIPYAHLINGNIPLMQQCLSLLLRETVTVTVKKAPATQVDTSLNSGIGHQQLGNDMICGTSFMEDYPVLHYQIGPLRHTPVTGYIDGGSEYLLLETFNNYFAPIEADIITEIVIEKESGSMRFDMYDQPVLGYSSVL